MLHFNKSFLNNIKVKYKLILIYIICVVAPILVINFIFYQNMATNVKEINRNYYQLTTQRITNQIESDLDFIINLVITISLDQKLYEMLDQNYGRNLDFAETYFDYFQSYAYLNGETYHQVSDVTLYTSNPTILNSGDVLKIDLTYLEEEWFNQVISDPDKLHIIYGQTKKRADNTVSTPISIVKVLKEFRGIDRYIKILEIELDAKNIVNLIEAENMKGSSFIQREDGNLIFADSSMTFEGESWHYINNNQDNIIQESIDKTFNWTITSVIDMEDLREALREPRNNIIFLTSMSLLLSSLIILLIYRSFYVRLNALSEHVRSLDQQDFTKQYKGFQGKDEIGSLIRAYNRMVRKIKTLIMDVYDAKLEQSHIKLEKKQAEINALQSQMNPHFLFNTLESIRMKSLEKGEKETADVIKYLARSFRRMISFQQEWIRVSEEVAYLKEFLKIQKYRFGSEFEYTLDVAPETQNIKIPKLIVQPFVENACIHGIEGIEEVGKVFVKLYTRNNRLHCIIKDNGIGIKEEKLKYLMQQLNNRNLHGKNIGMENIYRRLELYYGKEFNISIESEEGKGTTVILIIPLEEKYV
ncbi:MAG: sensor histidine kinase [Halanaerobiales bacterium]